MSGSRAICHVHSFRSRLYFMMVLALLRTAALKLLLRFDFLGVAGG